MPIRSGSAAARTPDSMRGLMIAAPQSGSGKTVASLALMRALKLRGLDIAGAKAGPDYIDPGFHGVATGRSSVNLDPWAMGPARLRALAARQGSEFLLVEAMMGLFDGAADGTGSAADLAATLNIPTVLVIDAGRQSHSVAALARGFRDHRSGVNVTAIILNRVGSERHETLLRSALFSIGMPVLGAIRRNAALGLPERHLGLVQAGEHEGIDAFVARAAEIVSNAVDLDSLVAMFAPLPPAGGAGHLPPPGQRVAIARDAAFSFAYPHQLADWRLMGAELSFFSPLADEAPAADVDAVFLPGGYPELHAGRIAAAEGFKTGLRAAAERGALVYGECGGYMALGEGLVDVDGNRHEMAGLLALETSFAERRLHLGYRRLTAGQGFAFGRDLTAHEFHYSTALREEGEPLFRAADATGAELRPAGLRRGNVMGSYMHVIDRVAP